MVTHYETETAEWLQGISPGQNVVAWIHPEDMQTYDCQENNWLGLVRPN